MTNHRHNSPASAEVPLPKRPKAWNHLHTSQSRLQAPAVENLRGQTIHLRRCPHHHKNSRETALAARPGTAAGQARTRVPSIHRRRHTRRSWVAGSRLAHCPIATTAPKGQQPLGGARVPRVNLRCRQSARTRGPYSLCPTAPKAPSPMPRQPDCPEPDESGSHRMPLWPPGVCSALHPACEDRTVRGGDGLSWRTSAMMIQIPWPRRVGWVIGCGILQ